jgi:hypothetical protein
MQNTQPNTIKNFLQNLAIINQIDTRQQGKIKYKLNEIVAIALIATIGNPRRLCKNTTLHKKTPTNPTNPHTPKTHPQPPAPSIALLP